MDSNTNSEPNEYSEPQQFFISSVKDVGEDEDHRSSEGSIEINQSKPLSSSLSIQNNIKSSNSQIFESTIKFNKGK